MQETNFIAIEGLDGAGKTTQIAMLEQHLKAQGRKVCRLHFPRTDIGVFGEMTARFLRGEFGKINEVNPYLVALLYAEDRRNAAPAIQKCLDGGIVVITDRYVYSNVAYQCAKLNGSKECSTLRQWILHLEYTEFGIPKPQKCLFLDVPPTFTQSTLVQQRTGIERQYLQGKQDIHETNPDFQQQVRSIFLEQATLDNNFHIIQCFNELGEMLPSEKIFQKLYTYIPFL